MTDLTPAQRANLEAELAETDERNATLEALCYLSGYVACNVTDKGIEAEMLAAIKTLEERIVRLENRCDVWRERNDSLASINHDVETRNDKIEALLVDLWNAGETDGLDDLRFRMRDLGLLDDAPSRTECPRCSGNGCSACVPDEAPND